MYKYIIKRILMMIPVLLGVSFIVFSMMYFTPGDPVRMILGEGATQADVDRLRVEMGLDQPFIVQYVNYIRNVVFHGDLGVSYTTGRSVTEEILARFPTTILLAFLSIVLSVAIGIPAGIISATKQYSAFDTVGTVVSLVGVSMPNFWQGLILIMFFSLSLGWFPPSGFDTPSQWVLPAITVGTSSTAIIMRMTRSSMLEIIRQDYIRTAYAKGQTKTKTIMRHALRNALIPIITVVGLQFGALLGGAVLTESIFSIPGLGRLMVESIRTRNFPMVQGGVLFIAAVFCLVNLIVDLLYAYVDPRIKSMYKTTKLKGVA